MPNQDRAVADKLSEAWPFPEQFFGAWITHMPDLPEEFSVLVGEAATIVGHFREVVEALQPFADGVFNDNGDMTVRTSFDHEDVQRAYFVAGRVRNILKQEQGS